MAAHADEALDVMAPMDALSITSGRRLSRQISERTLSGESMTSAGRDAAMRQRQSLQMDLLQARQRQQHPSISISPRRISRNISFDFLINKQQSALLQQQQQQPSISETRRRSMQLQELRRSSSAQRRSIALAALKRRASNSSSSASIRRMSLEELKMAEEKERKRKERRDLLQRLKEEADGEEEVRNIQKHD